MKARTTFRLLLAVCFLGAFMWFVDRNAQTARDRRNRAARVVCVRAEDVSRLTMERKEFRVDCVKKKGEWFVRYPIVGRADDGAIVRILSALESLPREEVITVEQRMARALELHDFGLDLPSRARVVFDDGVGAKELHIGINTPLGEGVYVKFASSEDVVATSSVLLDAIPGVMDDLRERTVISGDPSGTTRLEIHRPNSGFIQLMVVDGEWMIQQPVSVSADAGAVRRMLDDLYLLQVDSFVWDALVEPREGDTGKVADGEEAAGRIETYGLAADEATRVKVWMDDDSVGRELILGRSASDEGDTVYARFSDVDSIYTVAKGILKTFTVSVNDLRERDLFHVAPSEVRYVCLEAGDTRLVLERKAGRGWMIAEPEQWVADAQVVSDMIEGLCRLQAVSFVEGDDMETAARFLESPVCAIHMLTDVPVAAPVKKAQQGVGKVASSQGSEKFHKKDRLLIGSKVTGGERVYAGFEGTDSFFEISAKSIEELVLAPFDPLVYIDRTMLAVPRESIRMLVLVRGGFERTATVNEEGQWSVDGKAAGEQERLVIEDTLLFVSNLRALRIECRNPRNLAAYGLDASATTLTLGLSGEDGIQKSLMLGFRAKTDGRYAMVRGRDVIFVLPKGLADRLSEFVGADEAEPQS